MPSTRVFHLKLTQVGHSADIAQQLNYHSTMIDFEELTCAHLIGDCTAILN